VSLAGDEHRVLNCADSDPSAVTTVHPSPRTRTSGAPRLIIGSMVSTLAQIEYFVAVAEHKNVGRAAQALRIAQPAVSRQIRSLEDELGATLFLRTHRGMELSSAGRVFLEHARGILGQVRVAREAVRRGRVP
jgi:hypothetical protein